MAEEQCPHPDDLRASYAAIVDYHNTLVQMRFNVAGLFLAANAFLASGFFQSTRSTFLVYGLPTLGLVLAALCWLLEIRTYQLLDNLGNRGLNVESVLKLDDRYGFFSLMGHQPIGPRLLITRLRLPVTKQVRYFVSHSFGLGVLYGAVGVFWLVALIGVR
jgi:hypothetical protein